MAGFGLFTDTKRRSMSFFAQWRALNLLEKCIVTIVIGGLVFYLYTTHKQRIADHQELVRQQFHLPSSISFKKFSSNIKPSAKRPKISAVVEFTDQEFNDYVANINNSSVWKPTPFAYDNTTIMPPYTTNALRWTVSSALSAGETPLRWGFVSGEAPYYFKSALHFCLSFQKLPQTIATTPKDRTSYFYTAQACGELGQHQGAFAYIRGALDLENKSLHINIE